jgi:hypothetical protein
MTEITLLAALIADHEALGGTFPGARPTSLPALWAELHRQHRPTGVSAMAQAPECWSQHQTCAALTSHLPIHP